MKLLRGQNMMDDVKIFDIQRASFVDGPGIRTTIFFKGCNLKCKWCHNPESQSPEFEMMFYKDKCIHCGKCTQICTHKRCILCRKCTEICPTGARKICGESMTCEKVLKEILKDKDYYISSGGGVTFSGGECMLQINSLEQILKYCNKYGINTAVDTAGCVSWEYFEKIIPYTNIFLYDIKCISSKLHKLGCGISNKIILENLQKLSDAKNTNIIIRIPVVGGFNDDFEEMKKIADFLSNVKHKCVELLPYHSMGEHKYLSLGRTVEKFYTPSDTNMQLFKELFKANVI